MRPGEGHLPLKIIRPRIPVFSFRTVRADVARAFVNKAMANHLVLALESFATFRARAACDRAIVRSALAVDILVRAVQRLACSWQHFVDVLHVLQQVLCLESPGSTIWHVTLVGPRDQYWSW